MAETQDECLIYRTMEMIERESTGAEISCERSMWNLLKACVKKANRLERTVKQDILEVDSFENY